MNIDELKALLIDQKRIMLFLGSGFSTQSKNILDECVPTGSSFAKSLFKISL
jgi:hypothetical protein